MWWLVLCFLGLNPAFVQAQLVDKTDSANWQTELIGRYTQNRERTLTLARQNNWAFRKNYSSQRVFQLQEVDEQGQPIYYTLHNAEAAYGTRTQALYGMGALPVALSGSSSAMTGRLGLWDGGQVRLSHREFGGTGTARIVQQDKLGTLNDHTTHLAGTLIAQGVKTQAKGMAYGAQLSVWDYTDDIIELTNVASNLLLSNHAYGPVVGWVYNASRPGTNPNLKWEWWGNTAVSETEDYLFGFYTTKTRDIDRIAYNNPFFLMVRSADNKHSETGPPANTPYFLKNTDVQSTLPRSRNDAYDVIPAEATAKNVLTIGAANLTFINTNQPVLQGPTAFSGWGPTDDGRIKPDLLGMGSGVLSALSTSDTAYGQFTGTSMASANVTGSLFLLQELYARQRSPGLPTTGQFMRAATLKALAIHTASRANPANGPDYRQGWGLLNTEAAARLLLNETMAHLVLEKSLLPSSTFTQSIVAQGNEPLVITLSWTDPEGTAANVTTNSLNNRTPKLVNDLDLRLSNGQQKELPFTLDPNYPANAATRGDNIRDNVEQVYVANPVPGQTYTLTVSHKGKMTYSSQPFSVIVSGLRRTDCQLSAAIQSATDTTICAGATVTLRATNPSSDLQYQWFRNGVAMTGSLNTAYQVTQAGSYLVRITNGAGCSATSQPVHIQIRSATVAITPADNQWLCRANDAIQLHIAGTNSGAGALIDWLQDGSLISNEHTSTLVVTQPGRYQAQITQAGCRALSDNIKVALTTVNKLDLLPAETELTLPQGATVTLKAPIDASYQYQWYRNAQVVMNARDYQLSVSQPGIYNVQVTQQNCVGWSASRAVQSAILTAAAPDPTAQLTIYPNPAEQTLSIRYINPSTHQVKVSIFDERGHLQKLPIIVKAQNGQIEGSLSVQDLPAGLYILQLTDGDSVQTGRFGKK